jgi:hypothetical protein
MAQPVCPIATFIQDTYIPHSWLIAQKESLQIYSLLEPILNLVLVNYNWSAFVRFQKVKAGYGFFKMAVVR